MSEAAICHRCGSLVRRGRGELYIVRIHAIADPELRVDDDRTPDELRAEIERLIAEASRHSETELHEQVAATREIVLCNACYPGWIDDPTR